MPGFWHSWFLETQNHSRPLLSQPKQEGIKRVNSKNYTCSIVIFFKYLIKFNNILLHTWTILAIENFHFSRFCLKTFRNFVWKSSIYRTLFGTFVWKSVWKFAINMTLFDFSVFRRISFVYKMKTKRILVKKMIVCQNLDKVPYLEKWKLVIITAKTTCLFAPSLSTFFGTFAFGLPPSAFPCR